MATNVRSFTGASSDVITLALGATGFAFGPGTVLALIKPATGGAQTPFSSGATNAVSYMLQSDTTTSGILLRLNGTATNGSDLLVNGSWYLIGATKATGTVTPRLHIYDCTAGTWTHENASGTAANSSVPVTRAQLGSTPAGAAFFNGSMQLAAVWDSVLDDAAFDALVSLQAIITADPVGLWILDQASVATPVTDYTGNGADQTAISGTTVASDTIPNFDMTYPSPTIAFVGAGSGAAVSSGTVTATKTGCTAGNLIVVQVFIMAVQSSSAGTMSNVEDLAGTDNALTIAPGTHWTVGNPAEGRQAAYFGRVMADGTVSTEFSAGASAPLMARVYEFSGVIASATTAADLVENTESGQEVTQRTGTTTSILNNDVTTVTDWCLGLAFVAVNADQAIAAFSGETGGDWIEPVAEFTSSSPAGAMSLQTVEMPTARTVTGGSITISSAAWAADLTALVPAPEVEVVPGYQRLYGPAHLTASAATLYTVPDGARVELRAVHLNNPSGSLRKVTLSIGSDAAGTRFEELLDVEAGGSFDPRRRINHTLEAGEFIQGYADSASVVVATINGYVWAV